MARKMGRPDTFAAAGMALRPCSPEQFMNLYAATIPQFKRILQNVERWIERPLPLRKRKSSIRTRC
jgi:hypothetical protein